MATQAGGTTAASQRRTPTSDAHLNVVLLCVSAVDSEAHRSLVVILDVTSSCASGSPVEMTGLHLLLVKAARVAVQGHEDAARHGDGIDHLCLEGEAALTVLVEGHIGKALCTLSPLFAWRQSQRTSAAPPGNPIREALRYLFNFCLKSLAPRLMATCLVSSLV